jgi:hypothetical protein
VHFSSLHCIQLCRHLEGLKQSHKIAKYNWSPESNKKNFQYAKQMRYRRRLRLASRAVTRGRLKDKLKELSPAIA